MEWFCNRIAVNNYHYSGRKDHNHEWIRREDGNIGTGYHSGNQITNGNMSYLTPVEELTNISYPAHAAVVLSGAKNESILMIRISNVSLSTKNTTLTLQVSPLWFYDGEGLKSFAANQTEILSGRDRGINPQTVYRNERGACGK